MLLLLSHVLAFSTLFIASIFDLETTEVPDSVSIAGIAGGILLHLAASMPELSAQAFTGAFAAGTPLYWSLAVGIVFSLLGWTMYFLGMWGGADAFAMGVLGFAAPYSLSGPGIAYSLNLFVNILIAGFVYTLGFALYKALKAENVLRNTLQEIESQRARIFLELLLAAIISILAQVGGLNGYLYFAGFTGLIFLYRFLQNIQEDVLVQKIPVKELEGGEVIEEKFDFGDQTTKTFFGHKVESLRDRLALDQNNPIDWLLFSIEESLGSKVVGLTEGQVEELESREVEEVTVREGVRFLPVFPVALVVTDLYTGGLTLLFLVFN